jgi:hypothetical protein
MKKNALFWAVLWGIIEKSNPILWGFSMKRKRLSMGLPQGHISREKR